MLLLLPIISLCILSEVYNNLNRLSKNKFLYMSHIKNLNKLRKMLLFLIVSSHSQDFVFII